MSEPETTLLAIATLAFLSGVTLAAITLLAWIVRAVAWVLRER